MTLILFLFARANASKNYIITCAQIASFHCSILIHFEQRCPNWISARRNHGIVFSLLRKLHKFRIPLAVSVMEMCIPAIYRATSGLHAAADEKLAIRHAKNAEHQSDGENEYESFLIFFFGFDLHSLNGNCHRSHIPFSLWCDREFIKTAIRTAVLIDYERCFLIFIANEWIAIHNLKL